MLKLLGFGCTRCSEAGTHSDQFLLHINSWVADGALRAAGKRLCVANVAVARELACWVWEIGRRAEGSFG